MDIYIINKILKFADICQCVLEVHKVNDKQYCKTYYQDPQRCDNKCCNECYIECDDCGDEYCKDCLIRCDFCQKDLCYYCGGITNYRCRYC